MIKILFLSFLLLPLFSLGQADSLVPSNILSPQDTIKDSLEKEIQKINQLENLSWKRLKIKGDFNIVYYQNDTLYRIINDSKRLRADKEHPIQGESLLELYFLNGELNFGIRRCETPRNFSRLYSRGINYYQFEGNKTKALVKECNPFCECLESDRIKLSQIKKLIRKIKREL